MDQLFQLACYPAPPFDIDTTYLIHLENNSGVQEILPKTSPQSNLPLEIFHGTAIELRAILQQLVILVLFRKKRR